MRSTELSVLLQKIVNRNNYELLYITHAIVQHKLYRKKLIGNI